MREIALAILGIALAAAALLTLVYAGDAHDATVAKAAEVRAAHQANVDQLDRLVAELDG